MSLIGRGLTIERSHMFDINRRVTAHVTSRSWNETPHATYLYEPDITDFYNHYMDRRGHLENGNRVTFTVIMIKAIAEALKVSPKLNALLYYNKKTKVGIHHHLKEISIAIPYLLEDNRMITPTIHNAGDKTLHQIADALQDIKRRIRNTDIDAMQYIVAKKELLFQLKHFQFNVIRQLLHTWIGKHRLKLSRKQVKDYLLIPDSEKITPHDIFEASVLVSNLGSIFKHQRGGITLLNLISPQVFAVAINALQNRPVVYTENNQQKIGIRKILPLSLTIDHRALDGVDFIPFQNQMDMIFSNPSIIDTW
ncbi:MAG: 2-oxo acid dehydrogenase subunit E2 [Thermoplasmatota archaeon]